MRARHRHFNPANAGAVCALDARFLNLTNNTAVDSWTDRSANGNSPTESSTARPTFKTNEVGGQPAVVFDGAGNKLNFSSALWTLSFSSVFAFKYTAEDLIGNIFGQWASGQNGRSSIGVNQTSTGFALSNRVNFFNSTQTSGAGWSGFCLEATTISPTIISFTQNSGSENYKNYNKGTNIDSCTITAQYTGVNSSLGALSAAQTGNFDGAICSVSLFQSVITEPIRKRLEHSAAYSFKISCN